MPIGLSRTPRTCDALFRRALPGAASRVFSPPCREVLGCETWSEANAISKRLTGKGLSRQAFNIMPKIREMDELLASVQRLRGLVREVHPEVLFAKRAGRVLVSKKSAHGVAERVAIIASVLGIDDASLRAEAKRLRGAGAELDDVLDAAMALVVARAPEASIRSLPQPPEHDERGLAMEMIYIDIDAPAHTDPT
jgi:predicted RNase H-like nuclease